MPYLSGEMAMQVALVQTGLRRIRSPTSRRASSRRFALLAQGKPYGKIAEELNVSSRRWHASQLKQKLDAPCPI